MVGRSVFTCICEVNEVFLIFLGEIILRLILIVLLIVSTYIITLLLVMLSSELLSPSFTSLVLAIEVTSSLFDWATRANCLHSSSGPYDSCVHVYGCSIYKNSTPYQYIIRTFDLIRDQVYEGNYIHIWLFVIPLSSF